ncbi:hypothetical protein EGH21_12220 [Halomicroarcula sp. F13]|uniref:DUF456 domain-containing protein n=1 Tax=Haloarcula rubra TaxID=2487747 RepID=A0AAW4PTB0_9EURY|nr:hypothetical protein [Halomicroarcula rubra]MBX0323795.1 hypothetical protein [Halomicroarcula rubra]
MSERTAERTRETDTEADTGETSPGIGRLDGFSTETTESESESGSYFSLRALLFSFVAVGAGTVAGSLIPLVPFTALLGIPAGAFVHGLLASERRYAETALAGGLTAGALSVTSFLSQFVVRGIAGGQLGMGRLFAVAAAVGLVLALLGHYFGRDLRDGLTRDLA